MEDKKIIELFFARSEKALTALADKYGKLCMKVALQILHSREDSEECVNDSYLDVWNTVPPKEPDPLMSYIVKIVRYNSLDCLEHRSAKKRGGGEATVSLEDVALFIGESETPEDIVERQFITDCVNDFLRGLSSADRILFVRKFWFFDTYEELSEISGIKVGTLKSKISRIKESLRSYLAERGVAA